MSNNLTGSICLSDIPREQIKKVLCKDGVERLYLNIAVIETQNSKFGDTHFISCSPKKEERKEGVNYIIGNLKPLVPKNMAPTAEDIANADPVGANDDLPF